MDFGSEQDSQYCYAEGVLEVELNDTSCVSFALQNSLGLIGC